MCICIFVFVCLYLYLYVCICICIFVCLYLYFGWRLIWVYIPPLVKGKGACYMVASRNADPRNTSLRSVFRGNLMESSSASLDLTVSCYIYSSECHVTTVNMRRGQSHPWSWVCARPVSSLLASSAFKRAWTWWSWWRWCWRGTKEGHFHERALNLAKIFCLFSRYWPFADAGARKVQIQLEIVNFGLFVKLKFSSTYPTKACRQLYWQRTLTNYKV